MGVVRKQPYKGCQNPGSGMELAKNGSEPASRDLIKQLGRAVPRLSAGRRVRFGYPMQGLRL